MQKDESLPNPRIVQRDAMRDAADQSGATLDGMLARISAEVTAAAKAKKCQRCGKQRLANCDNGFMADGSACRSLIEKPLDKVT